MTILEAPPWTRRWLTLVAVCAVLASILLPVSGMLFQPDSLLDRIVYVLFWPGIGVYLRVCSPYTSVCRIETLGSAVIAIASGIVWATVILGIRWALTSVRRLGRAA